MKKIIAFSLVILLGLVPYLTLAEDNRDFARKDPIFAGALSWYVPGLGQFYAGAFLKGAFFWVVEETILVSTILTMAQLELNVTGDINLGLNIKSKENPDKGERRTAIILGTSLVLVHFVNIVDAINTTRKYNRTQGGRLTPSLSYSEEHDAYRFGMEGSF
ncbi:MAG: hypothetical protein ACUVWJ_06735 [Spirochaetota bacterium]